MSDPGFIAAAYTIVLGGLALYIASVARRVRAVRRTAEALEWERARDGEDGAAAALPPSVRPVEAPR